MSTGEGEKHRMKADAIVLAEGHLSSLEKKCRLNHNKLYHKLMLHTICTEYFNQLVFVSQRDLKHGKGYTRRLFQEILDRCQKRGGVR